MNNKLINDINKNIQYLIIILLIEKNQEKKFELFLTLEVGYYVDPLFHEADPRGRIQTK